MNQDNRFFGEILFSLNGKVNRRSSYIHNTSLKYHQGKFSHDRVLSNLKNEAYLQSPRYYQPFDIKTKSVGNGKTSRKRLNDSLNDSLQASLAKFHLRTIKTRESKIGLKTENKPAKRITKRSLDANFNTDEINCGR